MLTSGTRIGRYELVAPLGAGGMGEVYRAWDDRLERAVAIKLLPAGVTSDPDRLRRFVCEARVAGLLNHRNVLSVFDVEVDGTPYLVSELLEGETLRERLRRGPLSPHKAVEMALQLASGLGAIHESGFVHRDLKPENVFLTHHGLVKILDFGLALPVFRPDEDCEHVQTIAEGSEGAQSFSGTVAYLSPEHFLAPEHNRGCDHRSDLFSLGAILYEALTGVRAFGRASRALTMQAVLEDDPFAVANEKHDSIPVGLKRVIRHCLEKNPEERFQSARDLAFALEPLGEEPPPAPTARVERRQTRWLGVMLFGVVVAALATMVVGMRQEAPPRKQVVRSLLPIETGYYGDGLAMARDGSRLAYAATVEGARQLHIWSMDGITARAVPGTDGAMEPFFSYDGQWVGFFAAGKLKKVALSGGAPQTICSATGRLGASWGPDNTILFTPTISEGIWRVSGDGGAPQRVTEPDRTRREKSHRFAEWLPGGKAFIFYTHLIDMTSLDDARIEAYDLKTRRRRVVIEGGQRALYAPSHHLVYQRGDSLLALPFDAEQFTVLGPPTRILSGIRQSSWSLRQFSLSEDGLLVYAPGGQQSLNHQMVWVDRHGSVETALDLQAEFQQVQLSVDGSRLAVQVVGANDKVWIYEFARRGWIRLNSTWDIVSPIWAPGGARLAVGSSGSGVINLSWIPVNSSGPSQDFGASANTQTPTSWSLDGRYLAFNETSPTTLRDIWIMDVLEGQAHVFRQTPFDEGDAKFSPDGRWLAYTSNESGQTEVYVRSFAGSGAQWQISNDGGEWPVWSRDGRELFYRTTATSSRPGQMRAVGVTTRPTFSAAPPVTLFDARAYGRYDVSLDGSRFVMIHFPPSERTQLQLVTNWFEDLKAVVPQGGSWPERVSRFVTTESPR